MKLSLIPYHHPADCTPVPTTSATEDPFRVAYHVWKPKPNFKKTNPGEPDFRIAVVRYVIL